MKSAGAHLAFLCCLLSASWSRATTRDAHEPLVILTEQGQDDPEDIAFLSSAQALAAEIGVLVSAEQVPSLLEARESLLAGTEGEKRSSLVAWISREGNQRTIHLYEPAKDQLRARSIEVGASPVANAEALALILRAELLAILHGPPPPPPPPPLPPLPPPPAPSAPPPPAVPDLRWSATATYVFGNFLRGQGVSQGAQLGLMYIGPHLSVALAYGLLPGQEVVGREAVIVVRRHPVDLALGYATLPHHRLRWVAEGFVSGDWTSRRTTFAQAPLTGHPDSGFFLVGLGLRGRQELRIFRHLSLCLGLGADVLLNPVDFQSDRGARIETVARLARVRFRTELGIRISAF